VFNWINTSHRGPPGACGEHAGAVRGSIPDRPTKALHALEYTIRRVYGASPAGDVWIIRNLRIE